MLLRDEDERIELDGPVESSELLTNDDASHRLVELVHKVGLDLDPRLLATTELIVGIGVLDYESFSTRFDDLLEDLLQLFLV